MQFILGLLLLFALFRGQPRRLLLLPQAFDGAVLLLAHAIQLRVVVQHILGDSQS